MAPLKLDTKCLCAIIPASIYLVIYIPIIIYFSWKFYLHRHHIVIKKRYGIITIYEVIFALIETSLRAVASIVAYFYSESHVNVGVECLASLFIALVFVGWNERFYHLFYDMQWAQAIISKEWKVIINPQHKLTKEQSFYIVHKKDYGNWEYTKRRFLFPMSFIITIIAKTPITVVQMIKNEDYANRDSILSYLLAWNYFIFSLPIISLLTIYILINVRCKIQDNFFILQELKYLLFFICISHLGYISSRYVKYMKFINVHPTRLLLTEAILNFVSYSALMVALMISTCYVTNKLRSIVNKSAYRIKKIRNVTFVSINDHSYNMSYSSFQGGKTKIKLSDVLSNTQGFELFIRHLSYELSTECLLCLVELIQFQKYVEMCKSNYNNQSPPTLQQQSLFQCVSFPKLIPKSYIVFQYMGDTVESDKNANDMKNNLIDESLSNGSYNEGKMLHLLELRANKLYEKYFQLYSEYQVNLSFHTRTNVKQLLANLPLNQNDSAEVKMESLLHLFDGACNALYSLMKDSFRRFSNTSEFEKLQVYLTR